MDNIQNEDYLNQLEASYEIALPRTYLQKNNQLIHSTTLLPLLNIPNSPRKRVFTIPHINHLPRCPQIVHRHTRPRLHIRHYERRLCYRQLSGTHTPNGPVIRIRAVIQIVDLSRGSQLLHYHMRSCSLVRQR